MHRNIIRWMAVAIVVSALGWLFVVPVRSWLNANGGFVSAIGLFVIVPFAIWSAHLLERQRKTKLRTATINILVHELWHNLNYVGQIEQSYKNNFEIFETQNPIGVHVPHLGPRLTVITRFITVEHLGSLNDEQRWALLEICAQLDALQAEFERWRGLLFSSGILNDKATYEAVSSTLLTIIDPLMRNMLETWVLLLASESFACPIKQVQTAALLIRDKIGRRVTLHPTYKASRFQMKSQSFHPNDEIVCWRNDWPQAPVPVIELSSIAPLHDTWMSGAAVTGASAGTT